MVEPQVRKFCGPIFFTRSIEKVAGNVTANGSFGLVDTGSKRLLVTCYHVWDEFRKAQLENPGLRMWVCLDARNPVVFAPHEPLGQDRKLDLVTFDMQPLLAACEGREFYRLDLNPPPRVEKEDVIFFIGFPGHLRCVQNDSQGFTRAPYGLRVSSVDGLRFHANASRVGTQPEQFGGFSGCPCFKVREGRPVRLVGFLTSIGFGFLMFTHARCLNSDGTITKSPA